jgi:hypothetical protein
MLSVPKVRKLLETEQSIPAFLAAVLLEHMLPNVKRGEL